MPFLGKQILLLDAEHFRNEFDLFASGHTPQAFDVGENIPRHVDVAAQMQFGEQGANGKKRRGFGMGQLKQARRFPVHRDPCTVNRGDPKRLRKVARSLEGFGVRLQYSVFECPLDDLRLAKLKAELQDLLNHEEDQVLFVSLGANSKDASLIIDAMGLPYEVRSRVTII